MSIIDEALKKLGNESSTEEANSFSRKMNAAGSTPNLGSAAGHRKRRPISLLLAVALVGAGVVVYLLLPKAAQQPTQQAPAESSVAVVTPPPAPAQKKLATSAAAASVSAVSPVLVVGAVKQVAPTSSVDADTGQAASAPAWYEAGWKSARAEKWTDAFARWEEGMRSLPKDRMVIISNSYTNMDQFSAALSQHARMFPAIGVRQHLGGEMLYRVVVFPYGGGTRQVLPKVRNIFAHAGLVNASRVQERLTENSLPSVAKPVPETQQGEAPVVDQKSPPEQKPSVEKLETLNRIAPNTASAVNTNTGDWETRAATVRDLLKAENYPEVGKNAKMLTSDFPDRWEAWFWLGTAQLAQGQMDGAESSLERASKLNPKVAQIWVQRAVVAQERNDHAAAVKMLNMARELSPKSPQIYLNLGYSNDALGLTAEADKNYLRFLSLTEGDSAYTLQRKPIMDRLESRH